MSQLFCRETISIATSVAVVAIGFTYPNIKTDDSVVSTLVSVAHVGSMGMWFGIQTWVSFVAGLTKIKILPRTWFQKVQEILFHKYFLGGLMLNSTMLATYLSRHPINTWQGPTMYRGASLIGSCALLSFALIFKPKLDSTINRMHIMEAEHGQNDVVGPIKEEKLLNDPKYKELRKSFVMGHGIAMLVNFTMYGITMYHLYQVAKTVKF